MNICDSEYNSLYTYIFNSFLFCKVSTFVNIWMIIEISKSNRGKKPNTNVTMANTESNKTIERSTSTDKTRLGTAGT